MQIEKAPAYSMRLLGAETASAFLYLLLLRMMNNFCPYFRYPSNKELPERKSVSIICMCTNIFTSRHLANQTEKYIFQRTDCEINTICTSTVQSLTTCFQCPSFSWHAALLLRAAMSFPFDASNKAEYAFNALLI